MPQELISWDDFSKVQIRVGTVVKVEEFPEARRPALKVWSDFGPEFGVLKSSAQITELYDKEGLVGRQVVGVVNFPVKQIGPFRSEYLLTGFADEQGNIVLAVPDKRVPDGARLA